MRCIAPHGNAGRRVSGRLVSAVETGESTDHGTTRTYDQRFLAIQVWPYARDHMMHHDSVFGFLEHREFPDGPRHRSQNVGNCESNARLKLSIAGRRNEPVTWRIFSTEGGAERLVCEYQGVTQDGTLWVNVPVPYAHKINEGKMVVRVE